MGSGKGTAKRVNKQVHPQKRVNANGYKIVIKYLPRRINFAWSYEVFDPKKNLVASSDHNTSYEYASINADKVASEHFKNNKQK